MSDSSQAVVSLSIRGDEVPKRAEAVVRWLLETGVLVRNPEADDPMQPSAFLPGPQAKSAAPKFSSKRLLANGGVDVVVDRTVHHPVQNYEPPTCPHCAEPVDEELHTGLIEEWLENGEPRLKCEACGTESLVGDLKGTFTFLVGELAIVFHNWPTLGKPFIAQLVERLGPRARLVIARL